jgi:hypothetical protein
MLAAQVTIAEISQRRGRNLGIGNDGAFIPYNGPFVKSKRTREAAPGPDPVKPGDVGQIPAQCVDPQRGFLQDGFSDHRHPARGKKAGQGQDALASHSARRIGSVWLSKLDDWRVEYTMICGRVEGT